MEELCKAGAWSLIREEAPLPDGRVKKAVRAHRCDSVHILAFRDSSTILLLHEYRPFFQEYIWMLPSGKVDKEPDPEIAAARELREETGFRAKDLKFYVRCRHSENLESWNHLYMARGLTKDPLPPDETELMTVHELSLSEALENVLASPVVHTVSAYALFRYLHEHGGS